MKWQRLAVLFAAAPILWAGTLHLKTGLVRTRADVTDFQADGAKRFRTNRSHYLLEFRAPVSREELDLLAAQGATVTAAVPDNAVMIVAGDDFSTDGLDLQFAGRLRPEQKRSPLRGKAYVVEFHSDVEAEDARELLREQGLTLLENTDLQRNHYLVRGDVDDLANWDEVAYIFPASADLVSGRKVYTCGSVTTPQGMVPMFVKTGDGWQMNGLNGVTLQFAFGELTSKVPAATVMQEITRALMEWPKHGNVHFVLGTNPDATRTVGIKFAQLDHGDGNPFDGAGGILAHTFYPAPTNPEPLAGDMHLDAAEAWRSGGNVDLYTVALHEAGHALGLGHTDQPGAIMYPYYRFGAQISTDDIAGIEALYGPANGSGAGPIGPTGPTGPLPGAAMAVTIQNSAGGVLQTALQTTLPSANLAGTVTNAVGAVQVNWQTNHGSSGTAAGGAAWTIPMVPLALGANTITISAVDSLHQVASQTASITRAAAVTSGGGDMIPPTIQINSLGRSILSTTEAKVTLTGTATDNVGVVKITGQNALAGSGTATGTSNWTAKDVPLFKGTNTLILKAWDAVGNSNWRSISVVRN